MYLNLSGKGLLAAIMFCCASGFLLLGYDQGVMGGVVGYENNYFAKDFGNPDATLTGLIVSLYEVGCIVGAVIILFFGEKIGRRPALVYGGSIVVVGTIIQASSFSVAQLIFGRIFTGIGNGLNTATLGVYQSETCNPKSRGKIVTAEGIMAIFGALIAYWIDFGLSYAKSSVQWRFPVAFQAFFAICMAVVVSFLPESPRFLIKKGHNDEAKQVIALLAGKDVALDDERVMSLYTNICEAIAYEEAQSRGFNYKELFTGGEIQNFRRICLCAGIQFMEEMGGANMITYYMPVVLQQSLGVSRFMSLLLSGVNSITFFLSAIVPVFLIDRVGRRPLLIYGSVGMMITMIVLTVTVARGGYGPGVASILMIFFYEFFYATGGWMATPFLYPSEICTLRIRSKGSAIAIMTKWTFNFLIVLVSPIWLAQIGAHVYIIFSILNGCFAIVVYVFYPETLNLKLEDADTIFAEGDPITRGVLTQKKRRRQRELASVSSNTEQGWVEKKGLDGSV